MQECDEGYELFESDLKDIFAEWIKKDPEVGVELWSSMTNAGWRNPDKGYCVGYSFRTAGGIISEVIEEGDYLDWYCCGPSCVCSDRIARAMKKKGWEWDGDYYS